MEKHFSVKKEPNLKKAINMMVLIKTTPKVKSAILSVHVPIIDREIRFTIQAYKKPNQWATGYSSRCQGGFHVLLCDYENMREEQIEDEIKFLQEFYDLGTAYIYKNDNFGSYHVCFPEKMSLKNAYNILSNTNTDFAHRESVAIVRGKEWVLRITKKSYRAEPIFLKAVYRKTKREISTAHKYIMENRSKLLTKLNPKQYYDPKIYDAPTLKYGKEDWVTKLCLIDYTTGNIVNSPKPNAEE